MHLDCEHNHLERWRVRIGAGSSDWQLRDFCTDCQEFVGAALPKAEATDKVLLWPTTLKEWRHERRQEWRREFYEERRREREEWQAWYHGYLQTEQWQAKRQLVLQRCKNICEGCGSARATIVHHLTYDHC